MNLLFLRRCRRGLVAAAAALVVSWFCVPASAQSISIANEVSLPRVDKDGNPVSKRPISLEPEGVSFQDCVDDVRIRFTLLLTGFVGNATVEAWAGLSGSDCKASTARQGGVQTCWELVRGIPLQQTVNVDIPVRKIMSGAPPFTPLAPISDASACGKVDLATIGVHFLYFKPGELATAAADKTLQVKADTVGPSPPTGLKVLPGNTRIQVSWDNISGEGGVSVLTGVKVYCDPAGAVAAPPSAATDAGQECVDVPNDAGEDAADGSDAGSTQVCTSREGGASTPSSGCTSGNLVPADGSKRIPDAEFNAKFECGSFAGNAGTTVTATSVGGNPLVNGTVYAVAVAATDAYGNVGTLSSVLCETPEVTTDFWESYRNAGGGAGGGFCSTSGVGLPVGSLSVIGIFALLALSSIRKAWKDRR